MCTEKIKVIAVTGPTASGKSALAMKLCKSLSGELVSCDSMQIYRGMDIGTAKPSKEDMEEVPHHMIDVASPYENFSCADYASMAEKCIEDIHKRGEIAVICGGTGMYFERLVMNAPMCSPPADEKIRAELEKNNSEQNHQMLMRVDPESAMITHMNNRKRVIRALEIYLASGITKTEWDRQTKINGEKYDLRHISLVSSDREFLYRRIDNRVDAMLSQGLEKEVRSLALDPLSTAGQAIGYKEMNGYINGEMTLLEAADKIKQSSRNYAKRQLTWFKRYQEARFEDICAPLDYENIVNFLTT